MLHIQRGDEALALFVKLIEALLISVHHINVRMVRKLKSYAHLAPQQHLVLIFSYMDQFSKRNVNNVNINILVLICALQCMRSLSLLCSLSLALSHVKAICLYVNTNMFLLYVLCLLLFD